MAKAAGTESGADRPSEADAPGPGGTRARPGEAPAARPGGTRARPGEAPAVRPGGTRARPGEAPAARPGGTRARIRAAAVDLFYAGGYTGTTVRDLTDACALTPGALYNHFGSKDDLLFEIVAAVHDGSDAALDQALADAADRPAAERLEALTTAFTAFHMSHPRETRVAERDYIHLTDARRAEIVGRRRAIRDLFAAVLRGGKHTDLDDADAVTAASMAILNMAVAVGEWYDPEGPAGVEETARLHGRLALRLAGA